ncbi:MAG: RES family NAD+ phosphorylase [Dechloromonas sp.]|nr:RES family NAD+ phosphorylase [Dechloromonas sp.]
MSVTTWTPTALASEFVGWEGSGWRAVEAQHKVATMGLVHGNVEAQSLLEDILEEAKPKLPPEVEGLHWLLATPFRYWPLPGGSRFRRPADPGVFYGAEERETACAEAGYWRLQFWNESEFLSQQSKSISVTLFEFHAATQKALDLTKLPLVSDREIWVRTDDYTETQRLAENARQAGAEMIRYESVRLPKGRCLAILLSKAFSSVTDPFRNNQQTWSLLINPPRQVVWQRELSQECWTFVF